MFAMSVNDVPGWSVTMPPSGIGVPVAATPGLVPHAEVPTAVTGALVCVGVGVGVVVVVLLVLLLLLLHPAAARAATPARASNIRVGVACLCLLISPPRGR
jgi:hypothetical protein